MGFFDLLKSKPSTSAAPAGTRDKTIERFGRFATDKRAQNLDRMEALESLAKVGSADAAAILLRRFTFQIDPSITDQEEKEVAREGVLAAGADALEPIRAFCAKAESLAWPLKILKELVPEERYGAELLALLGEFDTEYARNTDPKTQLLSELEHVRVAGAREALERFLDDVSEPVRFVAVATTLAQDDAASVGALARMLPAEESVRVRIRVLDGLAAKAWPIPDDLRAGARDVAPNGFSVDGAGIVRRG